MVFPWNKRAVVPGDDISDDELGMPDTDTEKHRVRQENQSALGRLAEKRGIVAMLAGTNILSLMAMLTMLYAIMYHFPLKQFLWTSDARSVCAATPLSEPSVSAANVVNFAATAAVDLNSFDYLNWHRMLTRAQDLYLTPAERVQFQYNLQQSGIIKNIEDGSITLTSVVSGAPFIEKYGIRRNDNRYFWVVQVPITLWYYNQTENKPENRVLTFTVVRVDPSPNNPNGIAIDDIVSVQAAEKTGPNQVQ